MGSIAVDARVSRTVWEVEPTSGVVSYPAAIRQAAKPARRAAVFFDHSAHRFRSESICAALCSLSGVALRLAVVVQPVRMNRAVTTSGAFVIG